jgi:hypothetical protein
VAAAAGHPDFSAATAPPDLSGDARSRLKNRSHLASRFMSGDRSSQAAAPRAPSSERSCIVRTRSSATSVVSQIAS